MHWHETLLLQLHRANAFRKQTMKVYAAQITHSFQMIEENESQMNHHEKNVSKIKIWICIMYSRCPEKSQSENSVEK